MVEDAHVSCELYVKLGADERDKITKYSRQMAFKCYDFTKLPAREAAGPLLIFFFKRVPTFGEC